MLYIIITTISTVGYGFPYIIADESKIAIILVILVSLVTIPTKSGELIALLAKKSPYSREIYNKTKESEHIVITGTLTETAIFDFLNEFFHEDHGISLNHAVILQNHKPSPEIENYMSIGQSSQLLHYIQGNPLETKDLKRAEVLKAKSVVIMTNKQTTDTAGEDSKTVLLALYMRDYLKAHQTTDSVTGKDQTQMCIQLIKPESKLHYYMSLQQNFGND